ncbi:hypothetical protein FGO68_gene12095 [Halteria grandinella]|uniref:Uncharacterized protein n=1 Tax=Halteria grandinella TaxID=5974 RepID=A0A8J8STS0_HALGN|nr:hypothetical protein FGO68_gene12095 [Halteria grandinella]
MTIPIKISINEKKLITFKRSSQPPQLSMFTIVQQERYLNDIQPFQQFKANFCGKKRSFMIRQNWLHSNVLLSQSTVDVQFDVHTSLSIIIMASGEWKVAQDRLFMMFGLQKHGRLSRKTGSR